ncbi:MAG: PD-(D/E)XK nuclease-like domain-containing protein [Gemmataceae bacterium]
MVTTPAWKQRHAPSSVDYLIREPANAYHGKRGEYLSSHRLAEFRKCPLLYRQRQLGFIKDEDRPAYLLGRAAHTLILEGRERFDEEYGVGGPINPKTRLPYNQGTKAWAEWEKAQGRTVLTDDQFELISNLSASVHAHPVAAPLLRQGVPEGVVRSEYRGVPSQIRMDWFDPETGITDLKTCDDLTWFETDARRFGYIHQLAFYRSVLAQVSGELVAAHFIAVEKKPPFRTGVWKVQPDVLAIAQQDNEAAIDRLKRCQESASWPTGYEELRVYDHV